jgi:hypothetical protein
VADESILTTCPRDCYDACGIEVSGRDGVIRRVRRDRDHPVSRGRLCRECAHLGSQRVVLRSAARQRDLDSVHRSTGPHVVTGMT